jgi:hypothetical protein
MVIIPNKDYYLVEINTIGYQGDKGYYKWCLERFGKPDGSRWFFSIDKLYFVNEHDRTMFVLKWS